MYGDLEQIIMPTVSGIRQLQIWPHIMAFLSSRSIFHITFLTIAVKVTVARPMCVGRVAVVWTCGCGGERNACC